MPEQRTRSRTFVVAVLARLADFPADRPMAVTQVTFFYAYLDARSPTAHGLVVHVRCRTQRTYAPRPPPVDSDRTTEKSDSCVEPYVRVKRLRVALKSSE